MHHLFAVPVAQGLLYLVGAQALDGGHVRRAVAGDATGNDDLKHEGQADQAEGKVQKGVGDAKDKLSD